MRRTARRAQDKLSYDLWYIRHRNLAVDVAVCLKTAALWWSALLRSRDASPTGTRRFREGSDL